MSKAFLKHANCLYVTRNSKRKGGRRTRRSNRSVVAAEGFAQRKGDNETGDSVAAHPKRQRNTSKMTMSSQPLSHESGNYMQQMKHALRHAAAGSALKTLKCQGKTKLNSKVNSSSKAKVKVNLKVKYLECATAQGAATAAAHRHGSHKVSAVPAEAAAQCHQPTECF